MHKINVLYFALLMSVILLALPENNAQNRTTTGPPRNSTVTSRPTSSPAPTPTPTPITKPTPTPTTKPTPTPIPCPRRCPPGGEGICTRNPLGFCRQFANQCTLNRANCRLEPNNQWTRAPRTNCAPDGRPTENRRCLTFCPPRPKKCPPQPGATPVCIVDRQRRVCRLVANNCEWDRVNCERPRGVWIQSRPVGCRGMQVGDLPAGCRRR